LPSSISLNGFDTHSAQPAGHARLLKDLADGMVALKRQVYATVLRRWWSTDPAGVLNGRFDPLDILRA
jgi:uncharacterized protein (DUF1501 family)